MSSLPNPSQITLTPGKRHRHRRSAAISGDFDLMGLGLFSPSNTSIGGPNAFISPQTTTDESVSGTDNGTTNDLDKHFHFNNEDDFCKKQVGGEFSFPNKTPDMSQGNQRSFNSLTSPPRRHTSNYSLNSPIRLSHRKSASASTTPKTKFFLTEETNFNNENIPDAVIDLDEILEANLRVDDTTPMASPIHKRTQLTPPEFLAHDEFLSSPFLKASSSPFISSPLSTTHNPLFQQPIKELISDTEDIEDVEEIGEPNNDNIDVLNDNEGEFFTNPQDVVDQLYTNSSANSSCSSLKSMRNIEKTLSNSSNNSGNSNSKPTAIPSNKRSGAHANRYQSFYDQSFKISNALKVSSSESVNIVRSDSQNIKITGPNSKAFRVLGHSSSLPSLKSSPLKRNVSKPPKFGEARYMQPEIAKPVPLQTGTTEPLQSKMSAYRHADKPKLPKPNESRLDPGKTSSNSPSSINSNVSSTIISTNGTIPSTDHSSLTSQVTSTKNQPVDSTSNKDPATPSIIVSSDNDGNSSLCTDSTFQLDNVHSNNSTTSKKQQAPNSESPIRQLSPTESSFLKLMEIPRFQKPSSGSPTKTVVQKNLDSLPDDLTPKPSKSLALDNASIKLRRRGSKIINWLKRK